MPPKKKTDKEKDAKARKKRTQFDSGEVLAPSELAVRKLRHRTLPAVPAVTRPKRVEPERARLGRESPSSVTSSTEALDTDEGARLTGQIVAHALGMKQALSPSSTGESPHPPTTADEAPRPSSEPGTPPHEANIRERPSSVPVTFGVGDRSSSRKPKTPLAYSFLEAKDTFSKRFDDKYGTRPHSRPSSSLSGFLPNIDLSVAASQIGTPKTPEQRKVKASPTSAFEAPKTILKRPSPVAPDALMDADAKLPPTSPVSIGIGTVPIETPKTTKPTSLKDIVKRNLQSTDFGVEPPITSPVSFTSRAPSAAITTVPVMAPSQDTATLTTSTLGPGVRPKASVLTPPPTSIVSAEATIAGDSTRTFPVMDYVLPDGRGTLLSVAGGTPLAQLTPTGNPAVQVRLGQLAETYGTEAFALDRATGNIYAIHSGNRWELLPISAQPVGDLIRRGPGQPIRDILPFDADRQRTYLDRASSYAPDLVALTMTIEEVIHRLQVLDNVRRVLKDEVIAEHQFGIETADTYCKLEDVIKRQASLMTRKRMFAMGEWDDLNPSQRRDLQQYELNIKSSLEDKTLAEIDKAVAEQTQLKADMTDKETQQALQQDLEEQKKQRSAIAKQLADKVLEEKRRREQAEQEKVDKDRQTQEAEQALAKIREEYEALLVRGVQPGQPHARPLSAASSVSDLADAIDQYAFIEEDMQDLVQRRDDLVSLGVALHEDFNERLPYLQRMDDQAAIERFSGRLERNDKRYKKVVELITLGDEILARRAEEEERRKKVDAAPIVATIPTKGTIPQTPVPKPRVSTPDRRSSTPVRPELTPPKGEPTPITPVTSAGEKPVAFPRPIKRVEPTSQVNGTPKAPPAGSTAGSMLTSLGKKLYKASLKWPFGWATPPTPLAPGLIQPRDLDSSAEESELEQYDTPAQTPERPKPHIKEPPEPHRMVRPSSETSVPTLETVTPVQPPTPSTAPAVSPAPYLDDRWDGARYLGIQTPLGIMGPEGYDIPRYVARFDPYTGLPLDVPTPYRYLGPQRPASGLPTTAKVATRGAGMSTSGAPGGGGDDGSDHDSPPREPRGRPPPRDAPPPPSGAPSGGNGGPPRPPGPPGGGGDGGGDGGDDGDSGEEEEGTDAEAEESRGRTPRRPRRRPYQVSRHRGLRGPRGEKGEQGDKGEPGDPGFIYTLYRHPEGTRVDPDGTVRVVQEGPAAVTPVHIKNVADMVVLQPKRDVPGTGLPRPSLPEPSLPESKGTAPPWTSSPPLQSGIRSSGVEYAEPAEKPLYAPPPAPTAPAALRPATPYPTTGMTTPMAYSTPMAPTDPGGIQYMSPRSSGLLEQSIAHMNESIAELLTTQTLASRTQQAHTQASLDLQQTQVDALRELAVATKQRQFDTAFAAIPVFDGSDRSKFFDWIEALEANCYASGTEIKDAALARSAGPVRDCLMAWIQLRDDELSWEDIRKELQRNFSEIITQNHAAKELANLRQTAQETLRIYTYKYTKLHFFATGKMAAEQEDPTRILHFLASMHNTNIMDKIARSGDRYPKTLAKAIEDALKLEAQYQLSEGLSLSRPTPPQAQNTAVLSVDIHNLEMGEVVRLLDLRARTNACYNCGVVGHFRRDCPDAKGTKEEIVNQILGKITHTLTAEDEVDRKQFDKLVRYLRSRSPYHKVARKAAPPPAPAKSTTAAVGQRVVIPKSVTFSLPDPDPATMQTAMASTPPPTGRITPPVVIKREPVSPKTTTPTRVTRTTPTVTRTTTGGFTQAVSRGKGRPKATKAVVRLLEALNAIDSEGSASESESTEEVEVESAESESEVPEMEQ